MKKIVIILVTFLTGIFAHQSFSQNYFNLRFDYTDNSDIGGGVIAVDSGYYVFSVDIINQYNAKIGLVFTDTFGNLIWKKSYGTQGLYFTSGRFGHPIVLSKDKTKIYFTGTVIDSANRYFTTLWSFNRQGDSLWCKYYGDSTSFYSGNYCQITNDTSIIIAGAMNNGTTQAMLIKTDTLGNKLWEQNYGGSGIEYGNSVLQTPDDNYMMGITTTSFGGDVDMAVIKTDSNGNQQWLQPYSGNFNEASPSYIISLSDGNYALCGGLGSSISSYGWPRIIKINPSGGLIWDKKLGGEHWGSLASSIIEESNGDIVCAGSANSKGIIFKLNSNGDSLWFRKLQHTSIINPLTTNILWSLDTATNGGYICAGVIYPSSPDTGSVDTWVIKVDEYGCDTMGCQFVSVEEKEIEKTIVNIYPNPASGFLYIEIDEEAYNSETISFSIYDIVGKKILSIQARSKWESLDISRFATGTYIISVEKNNMTIGKSKFVKE